MIGTEQEAREWICPFLAMATSCGANCIASKCAMWRWYSAEYTTFGNPKETRPEGDGWEWAGYIWQRKNPARTGYCGLGGKP